MNRAHFAEAVGHPLGDPALDAQAFGEVAGVKRLRQRGRQQAAEIGRRAELVDAVHFDQMLVFDLDDRCRATNAAGHGPDSATLRFRSSSDFERQPPVRKDAREVDQLFEDIEQRSLLRTAAARDDLAAFAAALHQVLADDDRFDDQHVVLLEQGGDLVANRRERRKLDFDQLLARGRRRCGSGRRAARRAAPSTA